MTKPRLCKRDGCKKPVPELALKHGDAYCSSPCFRVDYGTMTTLEAAEQEAKKKSAGVYDTPWRTATEVSWEKSGRGEVA